jgi:hypothetical protein
MSARKQGIMPKDAANFSELVASIDARDGQMSLGGHSRIGMALSLVVRLACSTLAAAMAVVILLPTGVRAQAVGEIWGTVRDPSGALIPQANITAVEQSTGLKYSTVTTGAGNYSLTRLPIGTYTLTGGTSGFKVAKITGVTLQVSQQREVNFTLALAASTQEVTVSAAPPLLDTSNATLGGVISGQQVQTLPLNGRDITTLIGLEPGTVADPNGPQVLNVTGNSFMSSNGTRGFTSITYLDGSNVTNIEYGGAMMTNFNLDAVSEFRVLQNDYSAQYGSGGG